MTMGFTWNHCFCLCAASSHCLLLVSVFVLFLPVCHATAADKAQRLPLTPQGNPMHKLHCKAPCTNYAVAQFLYCGIVLSMLRVTQV